MTDAVVGAQGAGPEEQVKANPPEADKEAEGADGKTDVPQETKSEGKEVKRNGYTRKIARLEAQLAEFASKSPAAKDPAPASPSKPKLEDFKDYDSYYESLAEWKAEQKLETKLKERDDKSRQDSLRKEMTDKAQAFKAKAEKFKETADDFDEVLEESGLADIPMLGQILIEADPAVAYHLANNPDDLSKVKGMSFSEMSRFVGRIEARLELSDEKQPAAKTTKAPSPITPPRGNASTTPSPYDRDMTADEWKAWRAKHKRK